MTHKEKIVELMLDHGADPSICDVDGRSVLRNGVLHCSDKMVERLLSRGIELEPGEGGELLWTAIEGGRDKMAALLIESGADLTIRKDDDINDRTLLHAVLRSRKITKKDKLVRLMLDRGVNVNACDAKGHSVLDYVAIYGHCTPAVVQLLTRAMHKTQRERTASLWSAIDKGQVNLAAKLLCADVDVSDRASEDNRTLLHAVVKSQKIRSHAKREELVKLMLERGADINARDAEGRSALDHAMNSGCCTHQLAEELLKRGARFDASEGSHWLWSALEEGVSGFAAELVRRGADVSVRRYDDDCSVLHELLRSQQILDKEKLVGLMIEHGADVDARDAKGCSVLVYAIALPCCSSRLVEELLSHHATATESYLDAICTAPLTKLKLLPRLIEHQVPDEDTRNRRGVTVIENLISKQLSGNHLIDALKVIKEILDLGVPASTRGKQPCSLLNLALRHQNKDLVKLLLEYGADPQEKDDHGRTPLYQAASFEDCTLASRWLIEKGASIHACNENGQYPIHAACKNKSFKNLHLLLSLGADPNVTDKNGRTPFDSMVTIDYKDVAKLMIKHFALIIAKNGKIGDRDKANINNKAYCRCHYQECLKELEKMKVKEICTGVPYFSLFSQSRYDMLKLMEMNSSLADNFQQNSKNLSKNFSIYHEMITNSFNIAERRYKIFLEEPDRINDAFHGFLPDLVMENIAKYSTPQEIEHYQCVYYMSLHATL